VVPQKSIQLYSNKAEAYDKYRPNYASGAIQAFKSSSGLPGSAIVLDMGSGTGTLTRHLLKHFDTVLAIEPNKEMREIAQKRLCGHFGFYSIAAVAEKIPLPDNSITLITAGQSIHWFQPELTLYEFQRIAVSDAWLLLVSIRSVNEEFNQALESIFREEHGLLRQSERPPSDLVPKEYYFENNHFEINQFSQKIPETWPNFLAGLGTAAYAPDEDHPSYPIFEKAAGSVFEQFMVDGLIYWDIVTEIYYGHLRKKFL
jgi:ubiquinone/menaquinone biosynthesis C-methylase UbiE